MTQPDERSHETTPGLGDEPGDEHRPAEAAGPVTPRVLIFYDYA